MTLGMIGLTRWTWSVNMIYWKQILGKPLGDWQGPLGAPIPPSRTVWSNSAIGPSRLLGYHMTLPWLSKIRVLIYAKVFCRSNATPIDSIILSPVTKSSYSILTPHRSASGSDLSKGYYHLQTPKFVPKIWCFWSVVGIWSYLLGTAMI